MIYPDGEPGAVLTLMEEESRMKWRVVSEDCGDVVWYQIVRDTPDGKEQVHEESFEFSKSGLKSAEAVCVELNRLYASNEGS